MEDHDTIKLCNAVEQSLRMSTINALVLSHSVSQGYIIPGPFTEDMLSPKVIAAWGWFTAAVMNMAFEAKDNPIDP